MKRRSMMTAGLTAATICGFALSAIGQSTSTEESKLKTRYSVSAIDDATFYGNLREPLPTVLNQVLVEPSFDLRYQQRLTFSTSLIGLTRTYIDNTSQVRVKETYAGLSAGDFDFTAGRKMVRWGAGYAFTAAGVLDPPRTPTDPGDRLNLNQGRDMVKADYVHGPHALTLAWSTAALAPADIDLRDTTAFRYNVLVHGFDTSLIAGNDRGADSFGGLTFTRVLGQAWEIPWRRHVAGRGRDPAWREMHDTFRCHVYRRIRNATQHGVLSRPVCLTSQPSPTLHFFQREQDPFARAPGMEGVGPFRFHCCESERS